MRGVVAAGHPLTAEAGAQVLRAGGNAVDAALAAMVASFVAEPQLTGLGAGGYMLVAEPGAAPALLDFFVAAPGRRRRRGGARAARPAEVFFEAAAQVFHVGAASCGVLRDAGGDLRGAPPLRDAPARRPRRPRRRARARRASSSTPAGLHLRPARADHAQLARGAREVLGRRPVAREGDVLTEPELADTLERLGAEGAAPFYTR